MNYEITIRRTFSAAHAIRLHDGSLEPLHGHDWVVQVTVASERLDGMETVMDFHELQRIVDGPIGGLHNRNLNDVPPFADGHGGLKVNPTAERVASWLAERVTGHLPGSVRLICVEVEEAPDCVARYTPGGSAESDASTA
jgi:6-pyruvoyltetrahydropterin/6-carboxytetrahydropterin synthase